MKVYQNGKDISGGPPFKNSNDALQFILRRELAPLMTVFEMMNRGYELRSE